MAVARIPPNGFGIAFGLTGLSSAWLAAASGAQAPAWIGDLLLGLSAATWVALVGGYVAHARLHPHVWQDDLLHPVLGPFMSLALVVPMRLAALGIVPHAQAVGTVLVDALIALVVLHGGWFTGQLILGEVALDQVHPGYFLPTVAGGLLAATSAADLGQHALGVALFGLGVLCWIILGSIIMARLVVRPALPTALQPTLAIEVAPAAVATTAWLGLHEGHVDVVVQLLAGYGVLMVLAQVRLLPVFLGLRFALGFWSFTFSWAAVATAALGWLQVTGPPAQALWTWLLLGVVTVLVGGIAMRTVGALLRRGLWPEDPRSVVQVVVDAAAPDARGAGRRAGR